MQNLTQKIWEMNIPNGIFNLTVVRNIFPHLSEGARKALINRSVKKKEIHRLTRGIYYLNEKYTNGSPHPYLIANQLGFPSFISMETALSYHQLIPEAVYQVSSVWAGRKHKVKTPLGYFYYYPVPSKYLMAGVKVEKFLENFWIFMATPLRAIADIVYARKNISWEKDGMGFLLNSLRIEEEDLYQLDFSAIDSLIENINNKRTLVYIKKLMENVKNV